MIPMRVWTQLVAQLRIGALDAATTLDGIDLRHSVCDVDVMVVHSVTRLEVAAQRGCAQLARSVHPWRAAALRCLQFRHPRATGGIPRSASSGRISTVSGPEFATLVRIRGGLRLVWMMITPAAPQLHGPFVLYASARRRHRLALEHRLVELRGGRVRDCGSFHEDTSVLRRGHAPVVVPLVFGRDEP